MARATQYDEGLAWPARPARISKAARLVLDIVSALPPGVHAAAFEVHAEARRRQPGVGVSTIYRALDKLCAEGMVHAVKVPGAASALYEPARTGHAHFQCRSCRRVEDIDYDLPATDLARLALEHDIAIAGVSLTFDGLCRTCRATAR